MHTKYINFRPSIAFYTRCAYISFMYYLSFTLRVTSISSACMFVLCSPMFFFLFFTMHWSLRTQQLTRFRQTRTINSANSAISEINNKIPNEPKSAVIEAFLCGQCQAIVRPTMHDLIIGQRLSQIACQLKGDAEILLMPKFMNDQSFQSISREI